LLILLTGVHFACNFLASDTSQTGSASNEEVYSGINLSHLSDYQSSYEVAFVGDYAWKYSLVTFHKMGITEQNLHIEGVEGPQNPGDVRLVSDGETSWMTGPGVEGECVMFPTDYDIDYSFLSPDDVFPPESIAPLLVFVSEDQKDGTSVQNFLGSTAEHEGWRDLIIEMLLVKGEGYPILYKISAEGNDPIFDAGTGKINSTFFISTDPNYEIDPITGCEIPISLPEGASQIVRFPGLYSFKVSEPPENVVNFYKDYLTTHGWEENQPLTETDTGLQMSYTKGKSILVFYFKTIDQGVLVEVLQQD
jgi:hypothetical protein